MAFRDSTGAIRQDNDTRGHAFPSVNLPPSEAGDVASILSSRMTDIASDDGGEHTLGTNRHSVPHSQSRRQSRRQSTQPGDNGSRPDTGLTGATGVSSQRGNWSQVLPSRRGNGSLYNSRRGSIPATAGPRPGSAASRTHVPSLTSHAFFRPMSSQKLQAQRGPRMHDRSLSQQGFSEEAEARSATSTPYAGQSGAQEDGDMQPPPSRGTEMTEPPDDVLADRRAHGFHQSGSFTNGRLSQQQGQKNTRDLMGNTHTIIEPAKSSMSFRSNFLLPSRAGVVPESLSGDGQEKPSSAASSPDLTAADAKNQMPLKKPGSNYEYFTGNTVFCWGGRLQNARDRPVNILTGLFILVPSILFFATSASWLWHNISPAIPIIYGYLSFTCMSSFIHASITDPGVSAHHLSVQ